MKLFLVGHGRHGKTHAAEYLRGKYGLTFLDSSRAAAAEVVMPAMAKLGMEYDSVDACWADRHNHRDVWYRAICEYNDGDLSRLSRHIFDLADIYVGIRNRHELIASAALADLSIWIDASDRLPLEPATSMSISREDCDIAIDNNGSLSDFHRKLDRLMATLSVLQ